MAESRDEEPTLDIARGDEALSRQLRRSLATLRDGTEDEDFRRQLDDVIAGRMSLREAAFTGTFDRGLAPHFERGMQRLQEMSEAEREQLAQEGQAALDRLAAEAAQQRAAEPAPHSTTSPSLSPEPEPERSASQPPAPQTGLPTVHDGWEGSGGVLR
jgi:hypothetical protein